MFRIDGAGAASTQTSLRIASSQQVVIWSLIIELQSVIWSCSGPTGTVPGGEQVPVCLARSVEGLMLRPTRTSTSTSTALPPARARRASSSYEAGRLYPRFGTGRPAQIIG